MALDHDTDDALVTGRQLFYNLVYLWLSVIVIAALWTWTAINRIRIGRHTRALRAQVGRPLEERLSVRNTQLKDRGVKQAPFVVLIGAAMPSVLAEIAFLTHKQEGQLLKTGAYRQQIAESLLDAILRYQQSLKKMKPGVKASQF